ncbi:uncharacterized protein LOC144882905 isoform X6 [Branchiostoma floridae x Branchiostoma japonicum]
MANIMDKLSSLEDENLELKKKLVSLLKDIDSNKSDKDTETPSSSEGEDKNLGTEVEEKVPKTTEPDVEEKPDKLTATDQEEKDDKSPQTEAPETVPKETATVEDPKDAKAVGTDKEEKEDKAPETEAPPDPVPKETETEVPEVIPKQTATDPEETDDKAFGTDPEKTDDKDVGTEKEDKEEKTPQTDVPVVVPKETETEEESKEPKSIETTPEEKASKTTDMEVEEKPDKVAATDEEEKGAKLLGTDPEEKEEADIQTDAAPAPIPKQTETEPEEIDQKQTETDPDETDGKTLGTDKEEKDTKDSATVAPVIVPKETETEVEEKDGKDTGTDPIPQEDKGTAMDLQTDEKITATDKEAKEEKAEETEQEEKDEKYLETDLDEVMKKDLATVAEEVVQKGMETDKTETESVGTATEVEEKVAKVKETDKTKTEEVGTVTEKEEKVGKDEETDAPEKESKISATEKVEIFLKEIGVEKEIQDNGTQTIEELLDKAIETLEEVKDEKTNETDVEEKEPKTTETEKEEKDAKQISVKIIVEKVDQGTSMEFDEDEKCIGTDAEAAGTTVAYQTEEETKEEKVLVTDKEEFLQKHIHTDQVITADAENITEASIKEDKSLTTIIFVGTSQGTQTEKAVTDKTIGIVRELQNKQHGTDVVAVSAGETQTEALGIGMTSSETQTEKVERVVKEIATLKAEKKPSKTMATDKIAVQDSGTQKSGPHMDPKATQTEAAKEEVKAVEYVRVGKTLQTDIIKKVGKKTGTPGGRPRDYANTLVQTEEWIPDFGKPEEKIEEKEDETAVQPVGPVRETDEKIIETDKPIKVSKKTGTKGSRAYLEYRSSGIQTDEQAVEEKEEKELANIGIQTDVVKEEEKEAPTEAVTVTFTVGCQTDVVEEKEEIKPTTITEADEDKATRPIEPVVVTVTVGCQTEKEEEKEEVVEPVIPEPVETKTTVTFDMLIQTDLTVAELDTWKVQVKMDVMQVQTDISGSDIDGWQTHECAQIVQEEKAITTSAGSQTMSKVMRNANMGTVIEGIFNELVQLNAGQIVTDRKVTANMAIQFSPKMESMGVQMAPRQDSAGTQTKDRRTIYRSMETLKDRKRYRSMETLKREKDKENIRPKPKPVSPGGFKGQTTQTITEVVDREIDTIQTQPPVPFQQIQQPTSPTYIIIPAPQPQPEIWFEQQQQIYKEDSVEDIWEEPTPPKRPSPPRHQEVLVQKPSREKQYCSGCHNEFDINDKLINYNGYYYHEICIPRKTAHHCPACDEPLQNDEKRIYHNGQLYHDRCMVLVEITETTVEKGVEVCAECSLPIKEDETTVMYNGNEFHQTCLQPRQHTTTLKDLCGACKLPMVDPDRIISYNGVDIHDECIPLLRQIISGSSYREEHVHGQRPVSPSKYPNCQICGTQLGTDAVEVNGKGYCPKCYPMVQYPVCNGCGEEITGPSVTGMNRKWHPEHFTCSVCGVPFEQLNRVYYEYSGRAYCKRHYDEMYEICYYCDRPVEGETVGAFNKFWCEDHFKCSFCDTPFSLQSKFYEVDMRPACKKCYGVVPRKKHRKTKLPAFQDTFNIWQSGSETDSP